MQAQTKCQFPRAHREIVTMRNIRGEAVEWSDPGPRTDGTICAVCDRPTAGETAAKGPLDGD